jgi:hypothetical protein
MTGSQTFVGAAGVGLVAANFWLGSARSTVSAGLFGSGDPSAAHKALLGLGGEVAFVLIATVLAGVNGAWGAAISVVMVGLIILWAMHHFSPATATTSGGVTT